MTLRFTLTLLVGAILALTLCAGTALELSVVALKHDAQHMGESFSTVRILEETQVALLAHSRASHLLAAGELAPAGEAEARVKDLLHRAPSLTDGSEQALVDRLRGEIADYFRAQRTWSDGNLVLAVRRAKPALDRALTTVEDLVHRATLDADASERLASSTARRAQIVAVSLMISMLACAAAAIWILERRIRAPLRAVQSAMQRFSRAERDHRAPELGPRELRETARTFNEMAGALERKHEQLLAFVGGVAHDLRTPLAALRLASVRLVGDRSTTGIIRRQVDRLDRMLGDVLDATKVEAGRLELHFAEHDLRDVVQVVMELHESGSPGHTFIAELPPTPVRARCDAQRLEQVLCNLLSNAIKYSPRGGRVHVSLARVGGEAELTVSDEGLGVEPSEMHRIFDPFHRAPLAARTASGAGLGLSVSRRIVEAHGGTIECVSNVGLGSTFTVRIPCAPHGARSGDETLAPHVTTFVRKERKE